MPQISGIDGSGEVNDLNINTGGAALVRSAHELDGGEIPVIVQYVNTALPAGASTYDIYTVPNDNIVNLDAISINYTGTAAGVQVRIFVRTNAINHYLFTLANLTSNIYYPYNMNVLLDDTCILRAILSGVTLNDDITISAFMRRKR